MLAVGSGTILLWMVVVSCAIASAALTITKSKLFFPFREWVEAHTPPFWGSLILCSYCLSHWLAGALVFVTGWLHFTDRPILDWAVTTFAVIALSTVVQGAMGHLLMIPEAAVDEVKSRLAEEIKKMEDKANAAVAEEKERLQALYGDPKPQSDDEGDIDGAPWIKRGSPVEMDDDGDFTKVFDTMPRRKRGGEVQ